MSSRPASTASTAPAYSKTMEDEDGMEEKHNDSGDDEVSLADTVASGKATGSNSQVVDEKKKGSATPTAATANSTSASALKKQPKTGGNRPNPVKKKQEKKAPAVYDFNDLSLAIPEDYPILVFRDGMYMQAIVLESKEKDVLIDDTPTVFPGAHPPQTFPCNYAQHKYVYYVHYLRWDRRMDEWVIRDRVRFLPELHPYIKAAPTLAAATAATAAAAGVGGAAPEKKDHGATTYAAALAVALPSPLAALAAKPVTEVPWLRVESREEAIAANHDDDHGPFSEHDLHEHNALTKVKNIDEIVLGPHIMPTWYHSPFPVEALRSKTLWFCETCLSFFAFQAELDRHKRRCTLKHPPGHEIYRSKETNVEICMFEVDGLREHIYCENLCYIAKLFLDHKTLHEDTSIFLFYVLCEVTDRGCIPVGYFSKEKIWMSNNLACILTLPCHQRKGYGKFLISMSYELSKIENRVGGPERPLSDLGKVSYMTYWQEQLMKAFDRIQAAGGDEVSLVELAETCHMLESDVNLALKENGILVWDKGKWVLSKTQLKAIKDKKDEARKAMKAKEEEMKAKGIVPPLRISVRSAIAELIHWTPFNPAANKKRRADEDAGIVAEDSGGAYGRSRKVQQEEAEQAEE